MKNLRVLVAVMAVSVVCASQTMAALTFAWPQQGSVVRESVNVAIDARGVPSDAAVNFYLNGNFIMSSGAPKPISGGRQAYTWIWDTRKEIQLGNQPPTRPADGSYEISAASIGPDGKVIDKAAVNVQLSNRVTSVSPDTPVDLRYKYKMGQRQKYAVTISTTLAEVGGAKIDSTQPIQSTTYYGIASVEDIQTQTVALIRYQPKADEFSMFGKPYGPLPGFTAGSRYQLVNTDGRVVDQDLFSTVGVMVSPSFTIDYRTPLPAGRVQQGGSWKGPIGVSMPGLGDAIKAMAGFVLEDYAWAGGRPCARITIDFTGSTTLSMVGQDQYGGQMYAAASPLFPGADLGPAPPAPAAGSIAPPGPGMTGTAASMAQVKGRGTDWFAFLTGELIRRELEVELDTYMDQGQVQRLTEGLGLGGDTSGTGGPPPPGSPMSSTYGDQPGDEEMALAERMATAYSTAAGLGRRSTGISADGPGGTQVKLRVTVSAKLMN